MRVEVTVDGETREVELDMEIRSMDIQELVRLEEAIGEERFERIVDAGDGVAVEVRSPKVIRAVLWSKLATLIPGLPLDGFHLDLSAFAGEAALEAPIEIPMTNTATGETVLADVSLATGTGGPGKG